MSLRDLNESLENKYGILESVDDLNEGTLDKIKQQGSKVESNKMRKQARQFEIEASKQNVKNNFVGERNFKFKAAELRRKAAYLDADNERDVDDGVSMKQEALRDYKNEIADANAEYKSNIDKGILAQAKKRIESCKSEDDLKDTYSFYRKGFKNQNQGAAKVDDYFYVELEKLYNSRLEEINNVENSDEATENQEQGTPESSENQEQSTTASDGIDNQPQQQSSNQQSDVSHDVTNDVSVNQQDDSTPDAIDDEDLDDIFITSLIKAASNGDINIPIQELNQNADKLREIFNNAIQAKRQSVSFNPNNENNGAVK